MQKFGDVFKPVDDFFKKSFSFGHSVEVASATDAGVTVTGTAKVDGSKFSSSLKASKFAYQRLNLDKFEVGTDGKVAAKLILKEAAPGTEVTFEATDGTRMSAAKTSAVVGASTKQSAFTGDVSVDAVTAAVTGSFTTGYKNFLLGATGSVATGLMGGDKAGLTGVDAVVGYKVGGTQLAAKTKDSLKNLQIGMSSTQGGVQVVGRVGMAAPKLGFSVGKGKAQEGVTVEIGAKVPVDGATVSAAAGMNGKVRAAYQLSVSKSA